MTEHPGSGRPTRVFLAAAAAVVAAAGFFAARVGWDHPNLPYRSTDMLWPAELYRDVVEDGYPFRTFQFSAVTFWVPDVALYFAVRAAVGGAGASQAPWFTAVFLTLVGCAAAAGAALAPGRARRVAVAAVLLAAVGYVGYNARLGFRMPAEREFLLPLYRPGTVALVFAGLAVAGLAARRSPVWAAALVPLAAAGQLSDRFFAVWFAAPVVFALVFTRCACGSSAPEFPLTRRRAGLLAAAVTAGVGLGQAGVACFPTATLDPLANYYDGIVWKGWKGRLVLLAREVVGECLRGNLLVVAGVTWFPAAIWGVVAAVRGRPDRPAPGGFYAAFSLAAFALAVAAFVFTRASVDFLGRHPWPVYSRYFLIVPAAGALGWALACARWAAADRRTVRAAGLLLPLAVGGWGLVELGRADVPTHPADAELYPEQVRQVDEACARLGLRHGLASYRHAKPLSVLSRGGPRVEPVRPDAHAPAGLRSFHWLSNGARYWTTPGGEPVRFQFVLVDETDDLSEAEVVAGLGAPRLREALPCGVVLLVYDRPSDVRLAGFAGTDGELLNLRLRLGPRHAVRYPGAAFHAPAPRPLGHPTRVAEPGVTPPGVLAYGPFLTLPTRGAYRATFRTSSTGTEPNALVDVIVFDPKGKAHRVLAEARATPGADRDTALEFRLPRELKGGPVEFRTHYLGTGRLELHWVDVEEVE